MDYLENYRELTAIVYYDKFKNWRNKLPFMDEIPENELAYIILDGLVKPYNGDTTALSAVTNALQFTTVVDSPWYYTKKETIMTWLLEGTEIFKPELEKHLHIFAKIKNIFTTTNKRHNYIMVNICGDRRVSRDNQHNFRIPSSDGIPELKLAAERIKLYVQRTNNRTNM